MRFAPIGGGGTVGGVSTAKYPVKAVAEWPLPANTVTAGVMTASANGALPLIDSRQMAVGERMLVTREGGASPHVNNGWYDVVDLGSASTPWVLSLSSDAQQGQLIPGSMLYVEHGNSGEDVSGLDIVMNRVSTTTSPTDAQWSVLRAGDVMVDCLLCNGNTVAQVPVTTNGVLPVTPTIGYRYAALGPASYARKPQLRVKARVVPSDGSQSGGIWSTLEVGDIIIGVEAAMRVRICDSAGHINTAPNPGTSYVILSPTAGTSLFKLVGPSPGAFFQSPNSYKYDPTWQGFRAAGDVMLIWKSFATDMWMYMDGPPGRYPDAAGLDNTNRALYCQRQKATAGARMWVLATPEPITVGVTPLIFKPVAYS